MTSRGGTGAGETLAARLASARERQFVGRRAEQELWTAALAASPPPFAVLWIHGPGGVGKSTLLRRLARLAADAGVAPVQVDARRFLATPDGVVGAITEALGAAPGADLDLTAALGDGVRRALFIDTAEAMVPVESWLHEQFLPALPADCLVVIAGRLAPQPSWRHDTAWNELLRVISLRNLAPDDSRALLALRGVPGERHDGIVTVTHGHPLALSLVADVVGQTGGAGPLAPERSPDVVRALLERFSHDAPDELHRLALHVCAHARVTDEALLRAAVDAERAPALYDWLRTLSFVEQDQDGLHLHDLAADALDAELRARDAARYKTMHLAMRQPLLDRLERAEGADRWRAATDVMWLHRFDPVMGPLIDWDGSRGLYLAALAPADHADIVAATRRFEGEPAARAAAFWLDHQPESITVIRSSPGRSVGYVMQLAVRADDAEALARDPRAAAAVAHARATIPLRADERIVLQFGMDYETHMQPGATLAQIAVADVLTWLTAPRLAMTCLIVTDDVAPIWGPVFSHIDHPVKTRAVVGDTAYALGVHDWRATPRAAWVDLMAEREVSPASAAPDPAPRPPLLVLSQEEFGEAVRAALRDLTRPAALAASVLLRCRVVVERPGAERDAAALAAALRDAAAALAGGAASGEKLHAALERTYLDPAPTQEIAAELLGLPFSTYRRHLTGAVDRVVEWLWARELHGW